MATQIPIENIFFLYCYAWNLLPEGQAAVTGASSAPNLQNLLAVVLVRGLERQIRRGMECGYVIHEERYAGVRGKLLLSETLRTRSLDLGYAYCSYNELSRNTLLNRILKTTLGRLAASNELEVGLSHDVRALCKRMSDIETVQLSRDLFSRVQIHRNNSTYSLLVRVCQLVHESLLPSEGGKTSKFLDVFENEPRMSHVFETFVRNFANSETEFRGGVEHISWDAVALSEEGLSSLPLMKTDVTLRTSTCTLVVDAKYYREIFSRFRGSEKLRSSHLYQIFAYLKNMENRTGPDARASGLLIYPTVSKEVSQKFVMGNHKIGVVTLNMNQPWERISSDLKQALLSAI